jgi:hypothetical protein
MQPVTPMPIEPIFGYHGVYVATCPGADIPKPLTLEPPFRVLLMKSSFKMTSKLPRRKLTSHRHKNREWGTSPNARKARGRAFCDPYFEQVVSMTRSRCYYRHVKISDINKTRPARVSEMDAHPSFSPVLRLPERTDSDA